MENMEVMDSDMHNLIGEIFLKVYQTEELKTANWRREFVKLLIQMHNQDYEDDELINMIQIIVNDDDCQKYEWYNQLKSINDYLN